jgi:peptidoglycan biosynthesis protein MviN/MurJ (putative lipid II flippase)
VGRIALALVVMGATVAVADRWIVAIHGDWTAMRLGWRWIWLLATVVAGGAAYGATLLATGLRPRHLRA